MVAPFRAHARDTVDDQGVEPPGDLQVVARAERDRAEIGEGKAGDAAGGEGDDQPPALEFEQRRLGLGAGGELGEGGIQRRLGGFIQRCVVDRQALQAAQAVVEAAVQLEQVQARLENRDEGQEIFALQAALVEPVGREVRGRHDHHAGFEQRLEQPAQDHGVGDVGDVELVEAEQPGLLRQAPGEARQRVVLAALAGPAPNVQALVHLLHEGVEVDPPLGLDPGGLEEHVHQHRLAGADRADQIEALGRLGQAAPEAEALLPAGAARARLIVGERVVQALQLLRRQLLHGIEIDLARPLARAVGCERSLGHRASGDRFSHRPPPTRKVAPVV